LLSVLSLDAIDSNPFEKLETDVEIKYSRDADWAKETNENCLSLLFDLVDKLTKPGLVLAPEVPRAFAIVTYCMANTMGRRLQAFG